MIHTRSTRRRRSLRARRSWRPASPRETRRRRAWETTRRRRRELTTKSSGRGRCWTSNTRRRAHQANGQSTSSRSANTGASSQSRGTGTRGNATGAGRAEPRGGISRRRAVDGARDDVGAADYCQSQRALLFGFNERRVGGGGAGGLLGRFSLDAAEFFCVGEDEVHVLRASEVMVLYRESFNWMILYLVECEHLTGHLTTVGQSDAHSVVDLSGISMITMKIDFKNDIQDFPGTVVS